MIFEKMNLTENHIIIGIGGTGGRILKAFRKRLYSDFSDKERAKLPIGFIYVDSTKDLMQPNDPGFRVRDGINASFSSNELVYIRDIELHDVLRNPENFPGLKNVIGNPEKMQDYLGNVGFAAGQKRKAGRILFGASVQAFLQTLSNQYERVRGISGTLPVNIHIFAGLAGGTGSGALIDVIAQTSQMFPERTNTQGYFGANIFVYGVLPEQIPPKMYDVGYYHANGYAALKELNALLTGKYLPLDVTGQRERIEKVNINSVFLYSNVNEHGQMFGNQNEVIEKISDSVFDYLFLERNDTTVPFGFSLNHPFPLRVVQEVKFLKERYDKLINDSDPDLAQKYRTILHTEEISENFPDLFIN